MSNRRYTMSEISGENVEKVESQETTTKEMTTSEKFDSFSDEEKQEVLEAQQKFKEEHPDEDFDAEAYIDQKFKEKNEADDSESDEDDDDVPEEPEREKTDDLRNRGHALATSENLTEDDKKALYQELGKSDDKVGVIEKYEALEKQRIKEKEEEEQER